MGNNVPQYVIIRAVEEYLAGSRRRMEGDQPGKYQELVTRLSVPIAELQLSARPATVLRQLNIRHVYDLVQKSRWDLLVKKNFGHKSLREVQDKLAALGLTLGMTLDAPTYAEAVTAAVVAGMEAAAEAHAEPDPPEPSRSEDAQPPLGLNPDTPATAASPGVDLLER